MASRPITDVDLENYLDEALPPEVMAEVEARLRAEAPLRQRLAELNVLRDRGVHSLGSIWRRHRLTCPGRSDLGNYLLGTQPDEVADYIRFHLEVVGCRACRANMEDLQQQAAAAAGTTSPRRQRYFQSSAGFLPNRPGSRGGQE